MTAEQTDSLWERFNAWAQKPAPRNTNGGYYSNFVVMLALLIGHWEPWLGLSLMASAWWLAVRYEEWPRRRGGRT